MLLSTIFEPWRNLIWLCQFRLGKKNCGHKVDVAERLCKEEDQIKPKNNLANKIDLDEKYGIFKKVI